MIKRIKAWLKDHVDYKIVGEYYDYSGDGRYQRKFKHKYYLKKKRR